MPVTDPRYKLVNFRLSVSEYKSVFIACHAEGVRTVSEFARASVLGRAQGEGASRVELMHQLAALNKEIAKLSQSVSAILDRIGPEPKQDSPEE